MRKPEIWIVEDNESCQYVYKIALAENYECIFFEDVASFSAALKLGRQPDLVLADLMLKNSHFLDFFALEESSLLRCELIVVSSVDDLTVLRECYAEGALDYLTKPFNKNQLLAKVERACKKSPSAEWPLRPQEREHPRAGADELILDPRQLKVFFSDKSVLLTHKEYQILDTFQAYANKAVNKEELLRTVWLDVKVGRKTLDVHLFHLRKKLKTIGVAILFEAPHGYKLSAPNVRQVMQ